MISFISCSAGNVDSLHLRSSCAPIFSNISVGTGSVLSRCRPEAVVYCCFNNDGTQDLFSFLAVGRKPYFAQLVFHLSTLSVPVCFFQVNAGTMFYRVESNVHLQTNDDW